MTAEPDIELVVRIVLRVLDQLGRGSAPPALPADRPASRPASSTLVTEHDVVAAIPAGRLEMARGAVVTPLARDTARERGVELVEVG